MQTMVNKKAQLKIQQMAFMLIATTLFFILIGLFFLSLKLSGIQKQFTNIQEENAKKIISFLSNSPEFSCTGRRINCIDTDKAMVMKERNAYRNFWQVDSIKIIKTYPVQDKEIECTKGNYPECNSITLFENKLNRKDLVPRQSNFISLCRKEFSNGENYEKCEIGKLIVGFEEFR